MYQLEIDHLTVVHSARRRFRKKRASPFMLNDVSIRVRAGEAFGIVGSSGSGKSTLAHALAGLIPIDRGSIRFQGRPLSQSAGDSVPSKIQLLFQNYSASLDPRMTVQELLAEAQTGRGTAPGARELLLRVGLSDTLLPLRPRHLSGGQRQRLALARALAADPAILIADEPTSALDVLTQAHVLEVLRHAQQTEHRTLVLISHDMNVVASLCPHIAVLSEGRVAAIGDTRELLARRHDPALRALLDGYHPSPVPPPRRQRLPRPPRCV